MKQFGLLAPEADKACLPTKEEDEMVLPPPP